MGGCRESFASCLRARYEGYGWNAKVLATSNEERATRERATSNARQRLIFRTSDNSNDASLVVSPARPVMACSSAHKRSGLFVPK